MLSKLSKYNLASDSLNHIVPRCHTGRVTGAVAQFAEYYSS